MSEPGAAFEGAPISTVGIVGGGSAAMLTALALAERGLAVTCIESPRIPVIGVGESTTPRVRRFLFERLGLDPAWLWREVRPTWKLGIRFVWGPPDAGSFPFPFEGDDLHEAWAYDGSPDRQSLACLWMKHDRGPVFDAPTGRVFRVEETTHAYHLDNQPLLGALHARAHGRVTLERATIVEVERDDAGAVAALRADDGRVHRFDLYVDCSGFRSLLMGGALGVPFRSYASSLVTDRAIYGIRPTDGVSGPYTEARTMNAGWRWTIPLRREDHVGYVYASSFTTDDEAADALRTSCPGLGELSTVRFRSGRHRDFVSKNVVALGNAYGFVEPLESTALHMLVTQIEALLDAWPFGPEREASRDALNRSIGREWDALRDFLAVHYRFNTRLDTPLWRWARAECDLGGAAEVVDLYASAGPLGARPDRDAIDRRSSETFGAFAYDCLLLGQRVPTRLLEPRRGRDAWLALAAEREQTALRSLSHEAALDAYEAWLAAARR